LPLDVQPWYGGTPKLDTGYPQGVAMGMKRGWLLVVAIVVCWSVGSAASADDEWKTPEAKRAWLAWDRDVGDALQGRGSQPEKARERCESTLYFQGSSYHNRLADWERRRADTDLSFGTSSFPPDPPKPSCRAPMF